jgi:hypothetical protein
MILVKPDNFVRAEPDVYLAAQTKDGAFGQFKPGACRAARQLSLVLLRLPAHPRHAL